MDTIFQQHMDYLAPEWVMMIGVLLTLVLTLVSPNKTSNDNRSLMLVALTTVLGALAALVFHPQFQLIMPTLGKAATAVPVVKAYYDSILIDNLSVLSRTLILVGTALTILISHRYLTRFTRVVADYYALIMGASLGAMILVSATDLVTLFVGLETLSITSYILAGYLRRNRLTTEASFKYLVYGSAASAMLLFAFSILYGVTQTTDLTMIALILTKLQPAVTSPLLLISCVMAVAAIGFKLSLAPFHMWTPDVYDGAPTPVAAFLSVVSKSAAFALALRILLGIYSLQPIVMLLIMLLAVVSMTVGNFVALQQSQVKRVLAYSTIAQARYMILGLLTGSMQGVSAMLFYLVSYLFMNIGAFAGVIAFNSATGRDKLSDYAGLVQKRPFLVFGTSICLLSLAGMPITSGFFAKFFLFQSLAQLSILGHSALYMSLILFALINSVVSLYYYLKIIKVMVVDAPSEAVQAIDTGVACTKSFTLNLALTACTVITLLMGVFATDVFTSAQKTSKQLLSHQESILMHSQLSALPQR